ncbi:MAG TPA: hypothetical protein VFH83_05875 [Spirochaetia bacterium]|nr:hypothetical protein [Spirochaetia bacterium]
MNRSWLLAGLAGLIGAGLLLVSCASIPKPETESDTLVVGSFAVDYPDGFYNLPPRTLVSNIRLDFMNRSTGKEFWVITDFDGRYSFLSSGGQSYELKSFAYDLRDGNTSFSGSSSISYRFYAPAHSVLYLGDIHFREEKPTQKTTVSRETYWTFTDSISRADKSDEMKTYLQKAAKDTPWPSYVFVRAS